MRSKRIIFLDLNLISDRDYAEKLFEALILLKISWFGLSTLLLAYDKELLDLVTRSGCRGLLIGFVLILTIGGTTTTGWSWAAAVGRSDLTAIRWKPVKKIRPATRGVSRRP